MAAYPKILQLELRRKMFSAKYGLNGPIIISKFSQLVRILKEQVCILVTIVSHALELQDGSIPCSVDRNLENFLTSHIEFLFIFGQCGDNYCK